jgi:hypothetical protein
MRIASIPKIAVAAFLLAVLVKTDAIAQYAVEPGFEMSWILDPRMERDIFPADDDSAHGGSRVLVGMDFDGDGNKEILFATDETLAPRGPDPGFLEVVLYENNGDNSYEFVWMYRHDEGSNSLPGLGYGDIDADGLWEIYFGIPTLPSLEDDRKLFVFEQNDDGTFPDVPTLTWNYARAVADDFRPSGFQIVDVDQDGQQELITTSRTSGARAVVVASPDGGNLDSFTTWTIEFGAGEDLLGGGGVYDVDVFDFDNDGMMELWVNTWDLLSMTVWEATGADTYELQVDINQVTPDVDHGSFNAHDLLFGDIDGDDRAELVLPTTSGSLFIVEETDDVSTLTGDSFVEVLAFVEEGVSTRGGDLGDLDDDGNWDIVIGTATNERVLRIEHNGGSATDAANYEVSLIMQQTDENTVDYYYPLRISDDLDGDGFVEIVGTNRNASDAGQAMVYVIEATGEATATEADVLGIPEGYVLSQNYPNPFNPSTNVVFEVPENANVEVSVFDVTGTLVQTLASGTFAAGQHEVTFTAGDLPSGVYIIRMQTPFGTMARKAMLLK